MNSAELLGGSPWWMDAVGATIGKGAELIIPFGHTASPSLMVTSVVATAGNIAVTFNENIALIGSASIASMWTVTAPSNAANVKVSGIAVVGPVINLSTTEQTTSAIYVLNIPYGVVTNPGGNSFVGGYAQNFSGVGSSTPISIIQVIDGYTIVVVFSKPVIASDALIASNYNITPTLAVKGVSQRDPNSFILTTAQQSIGVVYTLTASNIRDLAYNPI